MARSYWPVRYWYDESLAPSASLSATFTDNEDGTGVTVAITGSGTTPTNTVYTALFSGDLGGFEWTDSGNRTGDGSLVIDLACGHYLGYVVSSGGGSQSVSQLYHFVVTDGLGPIHFRCLEAIQSRIRLLLLHDVTDASILYRKVPLSRYFRRTKSPIALPCILITPHRQLMPPDAGVNSADDVTYRCLVTAVAEDNQEPTGTAEESRQLLWLQKIARAFRNQRLPGVSEVYRMTVEPLVTIDQSGWVQNYLTSSSIINCISREPRGLS